MSKPVALQWRGQDGSPLNGLEGSQALQQEGPTTEAVVFLGTAYTPGQQARPDMSNGKTVEALVDTGAAISSIDEELANVLNLLFTGSITISGVSGAEVRDLRLVQIYLSAFEKVCYEALAAVKLTEGGQRHEVLLGRECLKGYRMIYDGRSGVVVFEDQSSPIPVIHSADTLKALLNGGLGYTKRSGRRKRC